MITGAGFFCISFYINCFPQQKLINNNFDKDAVLKPKKGDKESTWDIWNIRKEALERKLSDDELFRVLYHIAKHRGFFFHTKAEEVQEEDTKTKEGKEKARVKAGLRKIRQKLVDGGWETVGQMFCEEFKQTNKENRRKRNAKDKYINSIHRSLLKDEIKKIFEKQQTLGNRKAAEELKERYIEEILMNEKGIDEERLQKMMGRCEFTGKICAPKEGYAAERFSFFNRINTLELVETENKDGHLPLNDEERKQIEALAYKNTKVTFHQIRKALKLENDLAKRFNLCSYQEKDPEYNKKLTFDIQNGRLQFNGKHKLPIINVDTGEIKMLDAEVKKIFKSKKLWPKAKKVYVYYSDIRKKLNLSDNFRFGRFKKKQDGSVQISELEGYTKSEAELGSKAKYMKQFEDETFVELNGYHKIKKAIESCDEDKWEEFKEDKNKLEIIAEALVYHKSDETRTEYLKEKGIIDEDIINAVLKINMKQVGSYSKEAFEKLLEHMEKGALFYEAKEKAGFGKTEYEKQEILKPYSGFFENNPVVARVISQTKITFYPTGAANEVYIKDCEIDHIIPMSRSFNDSLNNKVLCTQKANQDKRDRLPFEWFEATYGKDSQRWMEFENRVKKVYGMPYAKRRNLVRKSWTEKDKERFLNRNLSDTRYAEKHIANYLRKYFDFSKSQRDDINPLSRIQVRSGGITAFLRHTWGLNKDRGLNDLHHATDALVVACSTYGHVYLVSNLARQIERKGKNWYKHFGRDKFKPWESIREDIQTAVGNVFVSRMPRHTVTAAAHKETVESRTKASRRRVISVNQGYAEMGDMVRADIFVDAAGKNYVVPIYSVDIFRKKPLPNKYITKADAPYDKWPSVKDDDLNFRFSLFKNDLISIDGKMYYVDHIRGTRPEIIVKNIDGAIFSSTKDKKRSIGYRKVNLKKYSVDILGNYKEVKQVKRLGNRFKTGE